MICQQNFMRNFHYILHVTIRMFILDICSIAVREGEKNPSICKE